MGATKIEFRLRVLVMVVLISIGYWAPWTLYWGIATRTPLLEWLALESSRLGLMPFPLASPLAVALAALVAAVGAVLRLWGTAYLGAFTVNSGEMKAGAVLADGPYRYLRNPLYLGTWCMFAAMAFLMPATGALVAMPLLTLFLLRLIFGEEAFLAAQLGQAYQDYLRAVPRLLPRLRPGIAPGGRTPHWLRSLTSELNAIGVFVTLAFFSWSYNNDLMVRGVIISFGVSIVARALLPGLRTETPPA